MMRGIVKNETGSNVVIYTAGDYQGGVYRIQSNSDQELFWFRGCITVVENERLYYFNGSEISSEYVAVGMFSTSIKLSYKNEQLSYISKSGEVVPLPKLSTCKNA